MHFVGKSKNEIKTILIRTVIEFIGTLSFCPIAG